MKVFKIDNTNGMLLNRLNKSQNGTILFYHPQCGHCNALKPSWEQMKERLKKKSCNIYEVNGEHMNDIHHPMKNVVQGFPSILNINKGKITEFEKERNTQNMLDFVMSNLKNTDSLNKQISENKLKERKVSFFLNNDKDLMKKRSVLSNNNINETILQNLTKVINELVKTSKLPFNNTYSYLVPFLQCMLSTHLRELSLMH